MSFDSISASQQAYNVFENFEISPFGTYDAWNQSPFGVPDSTSGIPDALQNVDPVLLANTRIDPALSAIPNGEGNVVIQPVGSSALQADSLQHSHSFVYFLEKVRPPFISHFDGENWTRMKQYLIPLGRQNSALGSAIHAVAALYEAEDHGRETTNAVALYYAAKANHATMLEEDDPGLELTLTTTLILLCFEIVAQQETVPVTLKPEGAFVTKLERWTKLRPWSPVVCRVEAWLKILHVKALHLGGRGLLCAKVSRLLSHDPSLTPSLIFLDKSPSPVAMLYDSLTSMLFEFYMQTQKISASICGMNRHHRSRGSLMDENEVDQLATVIRKQLLTLYQQRPSILNLEPDELKSLMSEPFLDPLVTLIDLCNAAYQIEIVDLGRAHGQWLTPTPEAQEAMRQVRRIIDDNVSRHGGFVNPGFMWSIFFYALEADDEGGNWAVRMLQNIHNPTCHSDFFAQFLEAVLEEQRRKGERVDCRYLCIEKFGVPPPFI